MARNMPLRLGADVSCGDGNCGQVSRIIVNPAAREVTHLVVEQQHRDGSGRLVPVDLVDAATGQIRLRCSLDEFRALPAAQHTEVVPDLDPTGPEDTPSYPRVTYIPMPGGAFGVPGAAETQAGRGPGRSEAPQDVTVDSVPLGEVAIRPELTICATDGEIGRLQGLVVEPGGHLVTDVILREGHTWGHKEVAVPIGAVMKIGTLVVHLSLTKHQVKDLPSVDTRHDE